MVKYLSGRVKRTPQDQLKEDRYQYLNLEQAEPNLSDPLVGPSPPPGGQYQLIAIPGFPGQRFWVPVGGGLIPGAITIFDEGTQVSVASSITQLNFVGAAVTANVSVQSPSGHPGIAATITVIPVTVGNEPPLNAKNGELWWESDTGDLFVRYDDADSSQWVTAVGGGRGPAGNKGEKGDVEAKGNKGEKGTEGQKGSLGDKGNEGDKGNQGDKGEQGPEGIKGSQGDKGNEGDKGSKGDIGVQGAKAGLRYRFSSVQTNADPGQGVFRFNNSNAGNVSQIYVDILEINSVDVSDHLLSWDDSNSLVSGYLYVSSNDNTDNTLSIFEITSATNSTGYITIGVQNGFGNVPSDQEQCVLNFSRTGDKGQDGEKGDKGNEGSEGNKGDKGDQGDKGAKGDEGNKGEKGDKGNLGDVGVQGDKGDKGDKGDQGIKGDKGNEGSEGNKGDKGDEGDKGDKGDEGPAGPAATKGDKGDKGEPGEKGEKGFGEKGDQGDKGNTGDKGGATNTSVNIGTTAPTSGINTGDLWWDSDEGDLYVYYDDGNSSQWVATSSPTAAKGQKGEGEKGDKGEPGSSVKGEPGESVKGDTGEGDKGDEGDKGQKGEPGTSVKGDKGDTQKGDKGSSGSSITVNNNADNRVITGSNTTGQLNAETNLTYNGSDLRVAHSLGDVQLNASDGAIELTRGNGGAYLDFKTSTGEDYDVRIAQLLTSNTLKIYGNLEVDGTVAYSSGFSIVPQGAIMMWSGAENLIGSSATGGTGPGWVMCNGSNNTPDLRNRFIVGAGTGGSYAVNANGGASSVTLSSNEIPSHYHQAFRSGNVGQLRNGSNMSANNYPGSGTGPGNLYETYNISASNAVSNVGRTSSVGGGAAHENRPPYWALCYIMKT